ncbi:unknown [Ruminococcus sp. CAG:379]|nr:unknown [Ruminococcus sp. CAG:379]
MLLRAGFHICVPEFIIAPAYGGCGITAGETEFYMISCIVHAAGAVDESVPIRIQQILMLVDEFLGQVRALEILSHGLERNGSILYMAISPPFQIASGDAGATLVRIVKIQGILQSLRKIDLYVIITETVRIREHPFLLCDLRRLLPCIRKNGHYSGGRHSCRSAKTACRNENLLAEFDLHAVLSLLFCCINPAS